MKSILPTVLRIILVMVGLVLSARSTFALEPSPASPENILKSGGHHCPVANLELEPARRSKEDFEKMTKALDQDQHGLNRIDGLRAALQENLPRMVLHDSDSGFGAEVYLSDQQVAFVFVHAPLVNQGGIGEECHMIEGLTAIAVSVYGYGKESDLEQWIPGALEESWRRAAGNRDPFIQRRFGSINAAVWGIAPDFVNLYLVRIL